MDNNRKWAWKTLCMTGILSLGIASCTTDSEKNDDGGKEAEKAYIRGLNSYTPNGTVWYFDVTQDLATDPDLSKAVELGQNISVYSVGEFPMTLNGDAKTVTKWKVDKKTLRISVDAILSFASTGITPSDIVSVSSTAAFVADLVEGIIVEFNPTTMVITKTHKVTPAKQAENIKAYIYPTVYNGKILFPFQWSLEACCEYTQDIYATMGVFDPATGSLTYEVDERALGLNWNIPIDEKNTAYVLPGYSVNGWIRHFYKIDSTKFPHEMSILKLKADGTIDDGYELNLKDKLPNATMFFSASFAYQGKIVFDYSESPITGSFDDRFATRSEKMEIKSVIYDLNTHEVKPFNSFDAYSGGVALMATIEGKNYFGAWINTDTGYDRDLLVQNGVEDFKKISGIKAGSFQYIAKLW